ncbi:MAG: carbon monoxide dehydrogenase subunit [Massilia sp.]|jgi:carbon monoxide dehydrogenase subunit G|nr:carbon monoxide dehydrogenase subunit [Massilia sp.]MDB5951024.1 carbon monoxide dehydrogenase subunit [Massilia sp.]
MNFTGEIKVAAAREAVFERLNDARFFAGCIDGVSDLQEIDPTHFNAVLETKVAYIRFKFNISVEIAESVAPHRIVAKSQGTPMGMVGRLTSTSTANLTEENGVTTIGYAIEMALTGKLGSLGQPVMRSKAKDLEKQFAANLKAAFEPAVPQGAA